jgi:hypothetical protein
MYRCKECNGINVHVAVWVNPNTGDEHGDAAIDPWCLDCEKHVGFARNLEPNSTENEGGS